MDTQLIRSVDELNAEHNRITSANQKHELLKSQVRLYRDGLRLKSAGKVKFSSGGSNRNLLPEVTALLM